MLVTNKSANNNLSYYYINYHNMDDQTINYNKKYYKYLKRYLDLKYSFHGGFEKTKNKYGDIIITGTKIEIDDYIQNRYNPKKPTVFNVKGSKLEDNYNLFFVYEKNKTSIYINDKAKEKVPSVINGKIYGSIVILFLEVEKSFHLVTVKTKGRRYLGSPAGTRNYGEINPEEVAIREVYEETGVELNDKDIIKFGTYEHESKSIGQIWPITVTIYYAIKKINKKKFQKIKNYVDPTGEIEYVKVFPVTKDGMNIKKEKVTNYHLLMANYVWYSKINGKNFNWKKNKPTYFKKFNLF